MMKEGFKLEAVRPVQPVASWLGGKRILAKRIAAKIDTIEHVRYAEPFVGMGGVFFRRPGKPQMEVINDISRDVVNLFRILQRHYPQFLEMLRFQLYSRKDFERLRNTDPDLLTDLERAARFLYLQKAGFGGMGRTLGVDFKGTRWNLSRIEPLLEDVHLRLDGVLIECKPYGDFIRYYDSRPGTLFYCDPPYWGCTDDYGKGLFEEADFERLRDLLKGLQGRFIMSINDTPEIRELFGCFEIEEVSLNYQVSGKVTPARELIISG